MNNKSGFSAIELIIVIGILSLLSVGFLSAYRAFNEKRSLEVGAENVASLLKQAHSLTLSSKNDDVYGVHLETARAVLFKGSVFVEPNPDNVEYIMPPLVLITQIMLMGSSSNVVFERLSGETSQYGTTTLSLTTNASSTKNIIINQTGLIEFIDD